MENRINISELLKDCPEGMELYSPLVGDCKFVKVHDYESKIIVELETCATVAFQSDGRYFDCPNAECILFPKGKTTWEGFVPPCKFEDGDVVVAEDAESFQLFLLKHLTHSEDDNRYDGYCYFGWDLQSNKLFEEGIWGFNRLATEEEKQKLFDAIKEHGYKWETKTLKKLPKFKIGDRIILKDNPFNMPSIKITAVTKSQYILENEGFFYISSADEKYVLEDKFDITTLVPFESKVLMRSSNAREWVGTFYSHYSNNKFYGCGMCCDQCIPYEGNEHLIGKTDDCNEYFKIWE